VKPATGAPPKLTTKQRVQLPDSLSKGAEYYGFEGEIWTRLRVGEVIKPHFGVHYEVATHWSPSETIGFYSPKTETTRLSSTLVTSQSLQSGKNFRLKPPVRQELSLPPLRGIIHAAGILDDGILQSLSWERFTKVLSPKVAGLLHLHRMTQHLPLDFLVCFSSVASLLGSAGQGNYAAANAFMDAFAHYRRGLGLPGLSINWGPWQEGGMAARLSNQHQSRIEATGFSSIVTSQGMQALAELLSQQTTQVGVFPINWQQFLQQLPGGNKMPFLEAVTSVESVKTPSSAQQVELLEQLQTASGEDCQTILVTYLQQQVAKVLQFEGPAHLNPHHALNELGLDSLTGVELRNQVQRQLGLTLSARTILQGPSIMELAAELTQQLTQGSAVSEIDSHGEIKELAEPTTTSWFAYHKAKPNARLNLFCFHPIGGNASLYREWSEGLPSDIAVLPVQFPGREARFKEPPVTQFNPLIETLAEVLLHKLDKPFAFYGHSFGVLISFELAHFLRHKYALSPQHLFLGGLYPPENFVSQPIWSAPPEQILNYYLSEISEIPQSVREDETVFKELMLTFKADIQLALDYHYSSKEKLTCPLSVFGGIDDPIASEQEILQWRNYTFSAFKWQMFPGKHLFLRDSQKLLLEAIAQELRIG
jgi:surfactin synthase thioesterase subunit/aryl carrier-like protein